MSKIVPIDRDIRIVGWDIDDTLVPEMEPKTSALEQMTMALSHATKIPFEEIQRSIGRVFERRGTDYHYLIQELDCFEDYLEKHGKSAEDRRLARFELVEIGKKWWGKARDRYPREIKGVRTVLKTLIDNGIKNFALSNATLDQACRRLNGANLFEYFTLVGGVRSEINKTFPDLSPVLVDLGYLGDKRKQQVVDKSKPDTDLAEFLAMSPEEIEKHVVFVGDSESDMKLMKKYKAYRMKANYNRPDEYVKIRFRRFSTPELEAKFKAQEKAEKNNGMVSNDELDIPVDDVMDIPKYIIPARKK